MVENSGVLCSTAARKYFRIDYYRLIWGGSGYTKQLVLLS